MDFLQKGRVRWPLDMTSEVPKMAVWISVHTVLSPPNFRYYGRIAPRSGLAYKYGVDILAGVCDSDYRGEIKVIMVNHGRECFRYSKGDRIAQLIIEKITTPPVEVVEELDSTERGEGGLGSTGVK